MLKKKDIKIYSVEGIKLASICAGMYKKRRYDLSLVQLCAGSNVSGVFTKNKAKAAPVIVTEKHIKNKGIKFLVINAGNANAGTGSQGAKDIIKYCKKLSDVTSCAFEDILIFSTGVIGERIKVKNIINVIPKLVDSLKNNNWLNLSPENNIYKKEANVGGWGGECTCPDGKVYEVGDNNNYCG